MLLLDEVSQIVLIVCMYVLYTCVYYVLTILQYNIMLHLNRWYTSNQNSWPCENFWQFTGNYWH